MQYICVRSTQYFVLGFVDISQTAQKLFKQITPFPFYESSFKIITKVNQAKRPIN